VVVEVELNRFLYIGHRILERIPLRLASRQFGAPSVETVLVLLDYDARLAGHEFSVSRSRRQPDARFPLLIRSDTRSPLSHHGFGSPKARPVDVTATYQD
jgi:hypothetical protein